MNIYIPDKTLKYKAVNDVTLEDKALIGLKLAEKTTGKEAM